MTESEALASGLSGSARRLAQHALAAGENRLELLVVELQEERELLFQAFGMALTLAALALLAGIAFTATIVVLLWDHSRIWPIASLMLVYAGGTALMYRSLQRRLETWQSLPETFNQLRRDSAALSRRLQ